MKRIKRKYCKKKDYFMTGSYMTLAYVINLLNRVSGTIKSGCVAIFSKIGWSFGDVGVSFKNNSFPDFPINASSKNAPNLFPKSQSCWRGGICGVA